jgi:hypothetical protein
MGPELWRRAEVLFHAALEQSPEVRRVFLDSACGQDTELRRHVDLLVWAEGNAGSFLDEAGVAGLPATILAAGSLWRLARAWLYTQLTGKQKPVKT